MLIGSRISLRILPHPGRLHEWIAIEEGLYQLERITPELLDFVMHQVSEQDTLPFRARPQDEPLVRNQPIVNSASAVGAVYYTSTGLGRFVPDLYGLAPIGLYVLADSPFQSVEDLAGVPVGVGMLAGSHFATLRLLADRMPVDQIRVTHAGGPRHRLNALLNREVPAAALQEPTSSIAEQLGLRRLAGTEYKRLFWVHKDLDPHALAAYFRVLRRAEDALSASPDTYRPLWERSLPSELSRSFNLARFGLGERLVFEPFTRTDFQETLAWLDQWDLQPPLHERSFEKLTIRVPVRGSES